MASSIYNNNKSVAARTLRNSNRRPKRKKNEITKTENQKKNQNGKMLQCFVFLIECVGNAAVPISILASANVSIWIRFDWWASVGSIVHHRGKGVRVCVNVSVCARLANAKRMKCHYQKNAAIFIFIKEENCFNGFLSWALYCGYADAVVAAAIRGRVASLLFGFASNDMFAIFHSMQSR